MTAEDSGRVDEAELIRRSERDPSAAGRSGLGVWLEGANDARPMRGYDILDPGTYRYLGTRTVWLRDPFPFGRGGEPIARKGAACSTALMSSVIVDRPGGSEAERSARVGG